MHRDEVTHVEVCQGRDMVVTASKDGHVKVWRKREGDVEFVKHFVGHQGRVISLTSSHDGLKFCSIGEDGMVKFFDTLTFDLTHFFLLPFQPSSSSLFPHMGDYVLAVGGLENKIN